MPLISWVQSQATTRPRRIFTCWKKIILAAAREVITVFFGSSIVIPASSSLLTYSAYVLHCFSEQQYQLERCRCIGEVNNPA